MPESTTMYRAVGKAYLRATQPEIINRLEADTDVLAKTQKDLTDRREYLERRATELMAHRNDIISAK